jgi:pyruvate dehydrogenase E2 component (dihydrolipoamide acetyltransferase)
LANDKIFNVEMPQMGESITEATILKWLKAPGDVLAEGDLLLEISTEKVTAEIPAPVAGTLVECLFAADATVPVETVIARIAPAGVQADVKRGVGGGEPVAAKAPEAPAAPAPMAAAPTAARIASQETTKTSTPGHGPVKKHFGARPTASDILGPIARRQTPAEDDAVEAARASLLKVKSTPLVRNIAADLNVDISRVPGSGAHGRVTKKDLVAFLESGGQAAASAAPAAQAKPPAAPSSTSANGVSSVHFNGGDEKREPLSRMRRLIARHMLESVHTSPHAYTVFEADMTRAQKLRESVRKRYHNEHGVRLTPLAFIVAAVAEALPRFPTLNSLHRGAKTPSCCTSAA